MQIKPAAAAVQHDDGTSLLFYKKKVENAEEGIMQEEESKLESSKISEKDKAEALKEIKTKLEKKSKDLVIEVEHLWKKYA